jgi:phenylacetate-CoA ligase
MLFGYPSVLWLIAQQAESSGKVLDNLGIKVAFVTSERLYDHQREKISSIFGCPVANGYGGRDAGFIAHQCPAGGMHITAEDIIVEIVDADGRVLPPGETGEVVVTHMATSDFPFIRYRTGDVAALDEKLCSCGRSLPLLKQIEGRTTDFLVAQDGTIMHGLALVYVVRDVEGIENFKIIQESQDLTRIQIEVNPRFQTSDRKVIAAGVKKRLGEKVEIKIEQLDKIPAEKSGKYRYVVSHVGQPSAHGCATGRRVAPFGALG